MPQDDWQYISTTTLSATAKKCSSGNARHRNIFPDEFLVFSLARLTPGQTRNRMAFEGKVDDPSERVAGGEWTRTARHMNLLRTAPQLHCVIITFLLSSFVRFFSRARFLLLPFNKEKKRIKNVETKVVGKRDVESNARKAQLLGKFVVASSLMNLLLFWCLQSCHVLGLVKISNWIEREMNHFLVINMIFLEATMTLPRPGHCWEMVYGFLRISIQPMIDPASR